MYIDIEEMKQNNDEELKTRIVYIIMSKNYNKVYIGSTCNSIKERLAIHMSMYKKYLEGEAPKCYSFDVIEHGDITIHELHIEHHADKRKILQIENDFIHINLNKITNKNGRLSRTRVRDDMPGYQKSYYQTHKDHMKKICQVAQKKRLLELKLKQCNDSLTDHSIRIPSPKILHNNNIIYDANLNKYVIRTDALVVSMIDE